MTNQDVNHLCFTLNGVVGMGSGSKERFMLAFPAARQPKLNATTYALRCRPWCQSSSQPGFSIPRTIKSLFLPETALVTATPIAADICVCRAKALRWPSHHQKLALSSRTSSGGTNDSAELIKVEPPTPFPPR